MSDYKKQFDEIQETINDKKVEKAKLEERQANFIKDIEQQREVFKELDITSEEAYDVLSKLDEEIKGEIAKCQKTLS